MRCHRIGRIAFALLFIAMAAATIQALDNPRLANPNAIATPLKTAVDRLEAQLRQVVARGRLADLRWPDFSDYRAQVENLYRRSKFKPVWIRDGRPTPQAEEMIAILQQADNAGLRAGDYDASRWFERLVRLQGQHTRSDEVLFDVALTVCSMRYVSDVQVGRINPRYFKKFALSAAPREQDLSSFVQRHLVEGNDPQAAIAAMEPPLDAYRRLQAALSRYIKLAKEEDDGEKLPAPRGIVFSGTPYAGVPRLTRLLRLLGDLPESAVVPAGPQLYSGALVEAVKHFQQRHGLRPDGYLDQETIEQLNVPLSRRVEQMQFALERFRWLRYDFPRSPVIINIPGFSLYALDRDGKPALTMTVDVGAEYNNTRTPVLQSNIEYVVFRPYWDVPLDIQKNEIAPNVMEDHGYLSEFNFELVGPNGKVVSAEPVTNKLLQQIRSGELHVRQKPGPANSLGLIKFVFPNRYDVYLHDIPTWGDYFSSPDRNISHGCIHVKEPAQLAAWMLRDEPEWPLKHVQHAMTDGPDNYRVNLSKPLPVLIVYMTAMVHEDGEVYFYRDIYGYDAQLRKALAKGYHVHH